MNNHSIRRTDSRERRRAGQSGPVERKGKDEIDRGGVASFLKKFQTLEELGKEFPEFRHMGLPDRIEGGFLEDFATMLASKRCKDRYRSLTEVYAPEVILDGVAKLKAMEEPAPRLGPRGDHILHYVLNREHGLSSRDAGDQLAHRFSGVKFDTFASMAFSQKWDVERLDDQYRSRLSQFLEELKNDNPDVWRIVEYNLMNSPGKKSVSIKQYSSLYACTLVSSIDLLIDINDKVKKYFIRLASLECTTRYFQKLKFYKKDPETQEADKHLVDEIFKPVGADVAREILLSMLRVSEQAGCNSETPSAGPEFERQKQFQRIIITTFSTMYETRDIHRAKEAFQSEVASCWPDVPKRGDNSDTDPKAFKAARKYVEEVQGVFSEASVLDDIDKEQSVGEFFRDIVYYYHLYSGPRPAAAIHIALNLGVLFTHTALRP